MDSKEIDKVRKSLLEAHQKLLASNLNIEELFATDPERVANHTIDIPQVHFDFSKAQLNAESRDLLFELCKACGVEEAIKSMFSGEEINTTENRPALHTALRDLDSQESRPEVIETLNRIENFVRSIREGRRTGSDNTKIKTVINIGIGGSDLGPALVVDALNHFHEKDIEVRFVSNLDPNHLKKTLKSLDPKTTLFIIASKSFKTLETLTNATAAKTWLLEEGIKNTSIGKHFAAITSNPTLASDFGVEIDCVFPIWDWVGGRFSLWSAIGLPIAIAIGFKNFQELLAGARSADMHFYDAPINKNIPVIMAILTYWYREYFQAGSTAVIPYSHDLTLFPSYLQQLHMESLGKSVTRNGEEVKGKTGDVIWGSSGTNGQHSYFQLLHQGTEFIPIEFIAVVNPSSGIDTDQHTKLLSNCIGQSFALMRGNKQNKKNATYTSGNRPSNTLLLTQLDPFSLGNLLALYEHKTFTLSVLWDINAFDQWGVELGKETAKDIYTELGKGSRNQTERYDQSTQGLLKIIKKWSLASKKEI